MMSRADKVVVVSGTVVSGTVVSGTVVTSITAAGTVSGNVDSTSTTELAAPFDALGVVLTAQADSDTKPSTISTLEGRKK